MVSGSSTCGDNAVITAAIVVEIDRLNGLTLEEDPPFLTLRRPKSNASKCKNIGKVPPPLRLETLVKKGTLKDIEAQKQAF